MLPTPFVVKKVLLNWDMLINKREVKDRLIIVFAQQAD